MDNTNETNNTELTITTININDLNSSQKRNKIFNWLKSQKIVITLIQETHSTHNTTTEWGKEWDGVSVWNSGPSNQSAIPV